MQPAFQFALDSWSLPIPVTVALILTAFIYLRGWLHLRRAFRNAVRMWQMVAFLSGLFSVWLAVGSPLGALDEQWLSVHMVQHLLLMTVAPPLILLGAPPFLLLHGLPPSFSRSFLGPLLRTSLVERIGHLVREPVFCWLAAILVLIGWHVPAAFSLGLQSRFWHEVEHASFFVAGLLFWWPVISPWPSLPCHSRWSIVLYLFLATLPCDALSAYLAFCDRVVYTEYLSVPRQFGMTALQDQECAGALMWVFVTFAYLLPAVFLTTNLLWRSEAEEQG
ncbi:MAG TPA: cytochrome c oxidase assembly protein [Candidatus Sulfotelmatobacter sp.]|nr:cytochrome c oxidase assembly protein [Candidatus Sulfotelmatobacter sp.]